MSYVEGFLIPVRTADRQAFLDHARRIDPIFLELGARRIVEAWGDNLPNGKVTDFPRAVHAKNDETVVFAWIEWPDRATRDAAMEKMRTDPRMMAEPMPFDGQRMVFGGFATMIDLKA